MCTYPVLPQLRETAAIGQSAAPFATDSPHLVMTDFGKPNVKAKDVEIQAIAPGILTAA